MATSEEVFEVSLGDHMLGPGASWTYAIFWSDSITRFCSIVPEPKHAEELGHFHQFSYGDHWVKSRRNYLEFGIRVTNLDRVSEAHFRLRVLWTV